MNYKLGKTPARPNAVGLKFGAFFNAEKLPTPPAKFGHYGLGLGLNFGMLANDKYSNCVFAGAAHETMVWTHRSGAGQPVAFDDAAVLADYAAVTGFDPSKPDTDQGTDMVEAASYRRKVGIADANGARHRIYSYVALRAGDADQLALATYLMGATAIGLRFPESAEKQFDKGEPWDYVIGSRLQGGHYVPCCGRNSDGNFLIVTWGRLHAMTPKFYKTYCVAPETRILTDNLHWVAAGDLPTGSGIMGFDEDGPRRRWKQAFVESNNVIEARCYDIEFEDGTKVRCSEDHKWLCFGGGAATWVRTDQTRFRGTGRESRVIKPVDVWDTDISREGGYIAAAFDGEGHLHQSDLGGKRYGLGAQGLGYSQGAASTNLGFSQKNNAMFDEVKRCLEAKGFNYRLGKQRNDGVTVISICRRREFLRLLGSMRPQRLLEKFNPNVMGGLNGDKSRMVKIINRVDVGMQKVMAIRTTSRTYIAEGLASHNCDEALAYVSIELLKNNLSPEGFNSDQLRRDLAAITN